LFKKIEKTKKPLVHFHFFSLSLKGIIVTYCAIVFFLKRQEMMIKSLTLFFKGKNNHFNLIKKMIPPPITSFLSLFCSRVQKSFHWFNKQWNVFNGNSVIVMAFSLFLFSFLFGNVGKWIRGQWLIYMSSP
jgi:hypothetical protein